MQAVARRKGASAPFTSLDNQAVAPGAPPLEDVWGLATPCFHPPKVASVTQSMEQVSKDRLLNEVRISCVQIFREQFANEYAEISSG